MGDKDEENPRVTEDMPLLSKPEVASSSGKRVDDDDWAHMYNFEIPSGSSEPYIPKQKNLSLGQKIKTRFHYYIPIFSWLPKYKVREQLLSDVLAGLGVGAMLIPQALSYALLAELPVVNGLLTAFVRIKCISTTSFPRRKEKEPLKRGETEHVCSSTSNFSFSDCLRSDSVWSVRYGVSRY